MIRHSYRVSIHE